MDPNTSTGHSYYGTPTPAEARPALPPRTPSSQLQQQNNIPSPSQSATPNSDMLEPPPAYERPPQRKSMETGEDSHSPIHYMRDPHKLVAYLVPFPKPIVHGKDTSYEIPDRFLIYTPPPPPLSAPKEGEKEDRMRKIQRKWQAEVREAKTSDTKITSWKGVKGKATRGINTAMGWMTSSNLDFLNRVPGLDDPSKKAKKEKEKEKEGSNSGSTSPEKAHPDDGDLYAEQTDVKKTVGLEEMVLIYPSSMPGDEHTIREEFVSSMLRSKTAAQRDAVIATGLLPVSFAIDVLATVVWPFGGLLEIDAVWGYSSFRGAKAARNVTKRLYSSPTSDDSVDQPKIRLSFTQSPRLDVLQRYLAAECHKRDQWIFLSAGTAPTESEVLEAIGWSPSQIGSETGNWEDEQWEVSEVKDDLRLIMGKGAKEWAKWCKAFEKHPARALMK